MGKLTARSALVIVKSGKVGGHSDGGDLHLTVPKECLAYWMLRYTNADKRKSMTLDKFEHISLADARMQAENHKKQVEEGVDPLAERKRKQKIIMKTVDDLFNDWYIGLQKRLQHPQIPQRVYTKDIAPTIGQVDIASVKPVDIRSIIQYAVASGRPTIANDALMYCKQLFNHAIKLGITTSNPASAFDTSDAGGVERSRDRALTVAELEIVFKVFRKNISSFNRDNYLACSLLLVFGVRKSELIEAKWEEFNLDSELWKLPASRSKSKAGIIIPLPSQPLAWLSELKIRSCGSEYVFPHRRSSGKPHMGKDTLNRAIAKLFGRATGDRKQPLNVMEDVEYFTIHDFRRTCRSLLASAGVSSHIAERCLNHKLKGVEGIYDRHDYFSERKEALQKIADLLNPIVNDLSNVVSFKRRA